MPRYGDEDEDRDDESLWDDEDDPVPLDPITPPVSILALPVPENFFAPAHTRNHIELVGVEDANVSG